MVKSARTLWLVIAGLVASVPQAAAQEPLRLTVDQAVSMALERNHEVLRAREKLTSLDGRVQEVKSQVYPQVGLEAGYVRRYDESVLDMFGGFIQPEVTNGYSLKTTLDQILFSWGRVSTAVEIARISRRQANQDLASGERRVKLQVHQAFYDLLLARTLVDVAEETLRQRQRHLEVARQRFEAGVVNEYEVIRARVDVANARTPVVQARNAVRQAVSRLNNLLARPQAAPIEAVGDLEYVPAGPLTLDEVVRRATEQRPELASLALARDMAEKNIRIAKAEDKPSVGLRAEYGFATQEFENLNPNREVWSVGVQLTLPLFDGWSTRGKVVQAESQLRDLRIATNQLREAIALEAKIALDDLRVAEEIIQASSLNIEQARKALDLAEASYRYGVGTALDVTDAQLGLTVARTDHARALHDYMLARARVLAVMNEL